MKILFVTCNYLPGKKGGIENYTHWLATLLIQRNYEVGVAVLNKIEKNLTEYEGVKIYPLDRKFEAFQTLLRNSNFDVCHFQEYSSFGGIELLWFEEARKYCNKVFFTFHLPYLTCYKGDFRYKGVADCNDFSSTDRCLSCCIASKLNYRQAKGSFYNFGVDMFIPLIKGAKVIDNLRDKIENRKKELDGLMETCDTIFIYGKWFTKLLRENGYTATLIKEISHISDTNKTTRQPREPALYHKLLFVGRIEKKKGLHLICDALNRVSEPQIQLDVYGNIVDQDYYTSCQKAFNFNYKGLLPRNELIQQFSHYDFLVLPSVFTEMNSLVLREAFYEQLPVIVSTAKGNKDVVTDGVNGFLFEYDNAKDLASTIDKAYDLKKKGWHPTFTYPENPERDIEEIISYYR